MVSLPPTRSNSAPADSQQLDLHDRRDLADFVEEQGAAMGQFKSPSTLPQGAGEGPFSWPNSSASEQDFRQRRAADFD